MALSFPPEVDTGEKNRCQGWKREDGEGNGVKISTDNAHMVWRYSRSNDFDGDLGKLVGVTPS